MKILFTGPRDIHATQALERALFATNDVRTEAIIVDWNDAKDSRKKNYAEFHFKKKKGVLAVLSWQYFLYKKLKYHQPDVVFNMSALSFVSIFIYSLFRKVKIVYDCRDYLAYSYKFNRILKCSIRVFDNLTAMLSYAIIIPDHFGKTYFNLVNVSKLHVIYNSVQDHGIRKKYEEGPIRIGYLGYLSTYRNIEAILKFVKNNPNIELHIACTYISDKLKDVIPKLDNIFLYERLKHVDAQKLLAKMDYCLLTYDPNLGNYKYIQPTKFYDCLALGLPYICSKGMVNLEKHVNSTSLNISNDYNSSVFPNLIKTDFSVYNSRVYTSTYSYDSILNHYRQIVEELLK